MIDVQVPADGFGTILVDPPWSFRIHKARRDCRPGYRKLLPYPTMKTQEIADLPVKPLRSQKSHLYLWVPNSLLRDGLKVMEAWGYTYCSILTWLKTGTDGQIQRTGAGFNFRNVTETCLFGRRGRQRTHLVGRRQMNVIQAPRRENSRKPDELYDIIERVSPGPFLELFARFGRKGWTQWGNQLSSR